MAAHSSRLLILHLLLLLGSIIHGKFIARRQVREADLKVGAQNAVNSMMRGEKQLSEELDESMKASATAMKQVSNSIQKAALAMVQAGSQNTKSVEHWSKVQSDLRKGINIVIDAYRNYVKVQERICEKLQTFAKEMIEKYENEISMLNKMTPASASDDSESKDGKDDRKMDDFLKKFYNLLSYGNIRHQTLNLDLDSIHDLTRSTLTHYQTVVLPPTNPPATHIIHYQQVMPNPTMELQTSPLVIPCADISDYNGNQMCPRALADVAQQQAKLACVCDIQ